MPPRKKKGGEESPQIEKEVKSFFEREGIYPAVLRKGRIYELFSTVSDREVEFRGGPQGYLENLRKLYPSRPLLALKATKHKKQLSPEAWGHIYHGVEKSVIFPHTDIRDLDKKEE